MKLAVALVFFWLPLGISAFFAFAPDPSSVPSAFDDRFLHGFTFTYLTAALCLCYYYDRYQPRKPIWPAWLWMLAYGVLIEVVQLFEPERSFEFADLVVDTLGILLGTGVFLVVTWVLQRMLVDSRQ